MAKEDPPIHPMQAMVDGMSAAWQKERSGTQVTLGGLIKTLESVDGERKIIGLGGPISYRGYYCDLAFEPTDEVVTVAKALTLARTCMGRVFTGYKGGDYMMGESTPIWSARYSDCGLRIMGLTLNAEPITLTLASEEDDTE